MRGLFCGYCGAGMGEGDLFCASCGKPPTELRQEADTVQVTQVQQVPQEPHATNPFSQFSRDMNKGEDQQTHMERGSLLGGIVALVLLAFVVTVGILVFMDPPKHIRSRDKVTLNNDVPNQLPMDQASGLLSPDSLPSQLNIKEDAILQDLAGKWVGQMNFTKMEGYDTIPKEELPPDFDHLVAQALSTPTPATFEVDEEGNWELYIDLVEGMLLDSDDYDYEEYPTSPLQIKALNKGSFLIDVEDSEDEANTHIYLSGNIVQGEGSLQIHGSFMVSLKMGETHILQEASYVLNPGGLD